MGIIRKLLAWLSVPIICLFALVFYAARPFNPDNNRYLAWVVARFGRAVLGMERPLEGWENMPQDRPTVVIANHQHNDDLFVLGDLLPPRTVTVGKSSLVWVPFFGQVFWLGGNVILNRGRSHKAIAVMKATSSAIARDRKSLWVFPEGTRSGGEDCRNSRKAHFMQRWHRVRRSRWSVFRNMPMRPSVGLAAVNRCLFGSCRPLKPRASPLRIFRS